MARVGQWDYKNTKISEDGIAKAFPNELQKNGSKSMQGLPKTTLRKCQKGAREEKKAVKR